MIPVEPNHLATLLGYAGSGAGLVFAFVWAFGTPRRKDEEDVASPTEPLFSEELAREKLAQEEPVAEFPLREALPEALPAEARPARGSDEVPPSKRKSDSSEPYTPIVRKVAPAVVNVYSRKYVRDRSPMLEDPFFRRFFGEDGLGSSRDRVQNALGSGVIVRKDGVIVTNNHVVADADELIVALADRREFEAKIMLTDERTDLAILKIDTRGKDLPVVPFRDSDEAEVGDRVLAIGNPFGVGQTVTAGIVSALARTQIGISDFQFFIQTDAAINPGNSGGALVTLDGQLIGINTAIFSRSGGSIGIGFAIPSNMARMVVDSAVSGGAIRRPWIGISGQIVPHERMDVLGLDRPTGVLVTNVYPGGPADLAGIKADDVILTIDGFDVDDPQALRYRVATLPNGKVVRVTYLRRGQPQSVMVKLQRPPETPLRQVQVLEGSHPLSGATVGNLSPAFAEELGLDTWSRGVVILGVEEGSPVFRLRARAGDIVTNVNGIDIDTIDVLKDALASGHGEWRLSIRRGDRVFNVAAKI